MLQLKEYQKRSLEALTAYFQACLQEANADFAFYKITQQKFGQGVPYQSVDELPGLPYVCLRLPTGGGKTLVAAYAVGIAGRELLHSDHPLALWLTPSNIIREQTLKALRDPRHPYRQALESQAGPASVLDISEALYIQPATLNTSTTVIVATMQAFRVEDTEGRKVYEPSGALMSHFSGLTTEALQGIETFENGEPLTSLANVLRLHRPIVIVDEAHNARTGLSFATLARFTPSCILEFTATPDTKESPSNVLHTVSAAELKTEGMIKLPILLETRADWREVVSAAVSTRNQLEEAARSERAETGEYIRPIVLLQAQPSYKNKPSLTVEILESHLVNDQRIPANQVARATGSDNEIEGINLTDPTCPIRYIITIQALREGWDCSFAYVLCTVAEMYSQTAVEQILGRVLRLPQAKSKQRPELNKAYTFAASANFAETAKSLSDALVQNGFEKQEVQDLIVRQEPEQPELGPLFTWPIEAQKMSVPVSQPPELESLTPQTAAKIFYDPQSRSLKILERLDPEEVYAIKNCFQDLQTQRAVETEIHRIPGAVSRTRFSLPMLSVRNGDFFEQFDESHFLDRVWKLSNYDPYLAEADYATSAAEGGSAEIDIDSSGHIHTGFIAQLQNQLSYLSADQGWTSTDLAAWLDRNIPHIDIPHQYSTAFIAQAIERLIADRNFNLAQLVKDKFRLKKAIAAKIHHYRLQARQESFQQFLLPDHANPVVVTPEVCFTYDPDPMNYPYPPNSLYAGSHLFQKHYYPVVGDLKNQGEEYRCALLLDTLSAMDVWVRNLEGRPLHSFWLQTSTDRFYPDFVCRLKDERYLVVEYKGGDRWSNDDSKEKRAIGQVWEERSAGKCLFIMPNGPDFEAIRGKVGG